MDSFRLLHQRSEMGYTHLPHKALRDEPEAVSSEAQERLSADAHRRRDDELRVIYARMKSDLSLLRGRRDVRGFRSELRAINQALESIGRRL